MHTISLRVSSELWSVRSRFDELLALLRENRDHITEVAFFTGITHPPLPLATIQQEAALLGREIIPAVRSLGLRAGINHLATLGHLDDENPENSLQEPWQHLVDMSGAESTSCYCAADPRVQEYISQCYAALATAHPDFIWLDDDVRLNHHPPRVRFACFCPFCLETFARACGHPMTREELTHRFNTGPLAERLAHRRQWQEHNNRYLVRLMEHIRTAVDTVNPRIQLGLMSGELAYCTYQFDALVDALAGKQAPNVKWRPGSGFYHDEVPIGALHKAHSMGRQAASLPECVTDIQYELENFPYQLLRKSRAIFAAEIAASIGSGCTGVALNMLNMFDPPVEAKPYLAKIRAISGFFATAARVFGRSACEGITLPFTPTHFSTLSLEGAWDNANNWGADFARYYELSEIGLPMAYSRHGAAVTLLTPENCVEYTVDDLRSILAGGVMLDGGTLERLEQLGLGELTGFRVCGRKDQNAIERFTTHALNAEYGGYHRDCRPSFWAEPVYLLEPRAKGASVLSEVVDFSKSVHGACAGVYENQLGGRVAVFGYFPWRMIQNLAKTVQLKAVSCWLSRARLPAYVASCHKMALWCRRDSAGHQALLVLNLSIDPAVEVDLHIQGDSQPLVAIDMNGRATALVPGNTTNGYTTYRLPEIGPWQAMIVRKG